MKKRLLWLAAVFLVLSVLTGASSAAPGKSHGQPENPLAGRVLQRSDLPRDGEAYYAEQLTADHFPGSPCPVNIPLQVEGFLDGYVAGGWYPLTLQDSALQGKLQRKQAGAYALSVVYQYRDEVQAATALERQLEWFHEEGSLAVDARAEGAGFDQSLAAANGVQGSAMRLTYSQEGLTWVSYWFFGVEGDTLMLLWVDGLPAPGSPVAAGDGPALPAPAGCYAVDWEVGGWTGGSVTFYGVRGKNYTLNPSVYSDDLRFVHSDWVLYDQWNLVELGWRKAHTWGPRWFAAWVINGQIQYANFDGLTPYTTHRYKVYNYHSDKVWRFVIDGVVKKTVTTTFDRGTPGAMRERHWSCDVGGGHWWKLKRSDWAGNFSLWQTWYDHDSDPYYYAYHPTTYEFFVYSN